MADLLAECPTILTVARWLVAPNAAVTNGHLQDFPTGVNGMARLVTLSLTYQWPSAQNLPGGGVTLAHELGHIYGRAHVGCPMLLARWPANPDPSYPTRLAS
jgi:hypothetical protein